MLLKSPRNPSSFQEFWRDLRRSYRSQTHDSEINQTSGRTCTIYFWFTAISEIYTITYHVIPHRFANHSDHFRYYMKVLAWFVFIETVANWICVKSYNSYCHRSIDQPFRRQDYHESWKNHEIMNNGDQQNGRVIGKNATSSERTQQNGKDATRSICIDIDDVTKPSTENPPEKKSKVYDPRQWWWCDVCQRESPPRSHHCQVCKQCILKRDHHCYMTGVCIGHRNQRYFVVLSAYAAIAGTVGLFFITEHLRETFTSSSYTDYVLPVTFYRCIFGAIRVHHFLMVCLIYTFVWSSLAGIAFFTWQLSIIAQGKTTFEVRMEVPVRCTSSVAENFRSVFGPFWVINFLFPAQLIFRQSDDGTQWNMKLVSTATNGKERC